MTMKPTLTPAEPIKRQAISPAELAVSLGLSEASVLRAIRKREIRAIRIGKRWLIPEDEPGRLMALAGDA